jgi:acetyl-CoA C-acetyltransferase
MSIDPTTPVIVGAGQVTHRPESREGGLDHRPEPVDLMVDAVRAAIEDCDGTGPGGPAPRGEHLVARTQSLRVVDPLAWEYLNPGIPVAAKLGIEPDQIMVTTTGGNNPQSMVNATALAIGRGEMEVAVLVGADCVYTRTLARRHADRPVLPWTVQPADTERPVVFGNDRRGTTEAEEERGLDLPIHVFPLFENALRAAAGRSLDDHRRHIGDLWSRFAEVAAANPAAWLPTTRTTDEITTPSDNNRMIAYPYTKLLTANMQVDQGAAIVMCSAEAAEAAGIPRDRWVFPRAGADADDHWFLSHRLDFHSSPAIRLCGSATLEALSSTIDGVAHVDLYSCFPSAVSIAAHELGLPLDDPRRPLTVTGGLTFAGGPGNNYGTHAVAAMTQVLRSDPGSLGLVTGLGWYLSKHSVGVYSTEPPSKGEGRAAGGLPAGTVTDQAGGFRWASPQPAVSALPQCASDADVSGEVTVETYSVAYDRGGAPQRAVVACRAPDGRRTWANVIDPDHLALLVTEEGCGRLGVLGTDGVVDIR